MLPAGFGRNCRKCDKSVTTQGSNFYLGETSCKINNVALSNAVQLNKLTEKCFINKNQCFDGQSVNSNSSVKIVQNKQEAFVRNIKCDSFHRSSMGREEC